MAKFTIFLPATDTHQEHSTVLFADYVFTFLRTGIGVLLHQLITGAEGDFVREESLHAILLAHKIVSVQDRFVHIIDCTLQSFNIAIFFGDDLLPIPLVNVERVCVIDIIVATKTPEISHNTLSSFDAIIVKSPSLPLSKREGHFQLHILVITGGKCCGALDTVKVVIESRALGQEERARHTLKVDVFLEFFLESGLDHQESFLLLQ
mmetsp:Transcript_20282/g.26169  ORF Transcript_20282/g.26169 Transcript_20282/m.26169 type:complete len:207 (+) Transcript_20282:674-1294(+)